MESRPGPSKTPKLLTPLAEGAPVALVAFRPSTGKVAYANAAFTELMGVSRGQLDGRDFYFCVGKTVSKEVRAALVPLIDGKVKAVSVELSLEVPLYPARCVDATFTLVRPTPQRPLVCGYLRDSTERCEREEALQRRIAFLEEVVGGTMQSIIATDMRGRIVLFNRGAQALLGYGEAEAVGRRFIQDLYEGNPASQVMAQTRGPDHGGPGVLDRFQAILISKNRERIPVWLSVHMLHDEEGGEAGTVTFVQDMRETVEMERRLEEVQMQLIHADKMASLGKLAAGVAHEINNPLGGILLFGGLLLEDMDFSDPRREDMDRIVQEARRCREIVNSLLDFAHQKKRYHEPVDLNAAVEQCMTLLGNKALFHNITIHTELCPSLPLVTGNPSQIKQVFTNIVTNAADAMDGEGVLTICSSYNEAAGEVCVSFTDTGPGIPGNLRSRIFDPFFTTKEPGKGTGLGLSLSYNIIRMHRGDIRVTCPGSGGTTFSVAIPVAEEDGS